LYEKRGDVHPNAGEDPQDDDEDEVKIEVDYVKVFKMTFAAFVWC